MNQSNNKESFKEIVNTDAHTLKLAERLKSGELGCDDLSDEELDQMIEFFSNEIKEKDKEIEKIKKEIIEIKRRLNT